MTRLLTFTLGISLTALIASCASQKVPKEPPQPEPDPLALEVRDILKNRCWQCHGQPDHESFGEVVPLDWILDYDKLIEHRLVLPDSAKKSRLVYLIVMGEMPREMDEHGSPSGRAEMPEEEIQTVVDWVKQGAPAWPEID